MNTYTSGTYRTIHAGTPSEYRSFIPSPINELFVLQDQSTHTIHEEASRLLGELNAYARLIPDIGFFIKMHINAEAVSSTRIEGTRTNIEEAILPEEEITPERKDDWNEVHNYIAALNWAIAELDAVPVSTRLITATHRILLAGVRGMNKMPGEFRTSQNWIGGASIRTAHFIPPPSEEVGSLLSDWEKCWHNDALHIPVLIKIAILHYQFETIHPFLDGNGRIGRLLITLQLMERGFLDKPVLYLSDFFEQYRQSYYEQLDSVRSENNLEGWVRFFLEGIVKTCTKGKQKLEDIITLREQYEERISVLGRRVPRARRLLNALYSRPVMSVNDVSTEVEVTFSTANELVQELVDLCILKEITSFSRNRLFKMVDYVTIFQK